MKRNLLALALIAGPASGQTTVFQDGFENGLAQWTTTGLWHAVTVADPCMATTAPFPEGSSAAWYGSSATCDYSTGTSPNSGTLELNSWIQLPTNVASITLYYTSWTYTEYCRGIVDTHSVGIYAQNGPATSLGEFVCATTHSFSPPVLLPWHERRLDLTAYQGAQVRVWFYFDTHDFLVNNTTGWLVDDVRIIAEPGSTFCPSGGPLSFCPCSPGYGWGGGCAHSSGASATLMSAGVASVAADSLQFTAAHMPAGTSAILFQGTVPGTPTSWMGYLGDGFLCLGGAVIRMGTASAPSGMVTWPLPGLPPLSAAGLVPPIGGNRYYQVLFRDSAAFCTSATYNTTNGVSLTWGP